MFDRTDIKEKLIAYRDKRVNEDDILREVYRVFEENEKERQDIELRLTQETAPNKTNRLDIDLLAGENLFHISDIEAICSTYRLRFLNSKYFKGQIPEEAISKIRVLETEHKKRLENFKIIARAALMKLVNAEETLHFATVYID